MEHQRSRIAIISKKKFRVRWAVAIAWLKLASAAVVSPLALAQRAETNEQSACTAGENGARSAMSRAAAIASACRPSISSTCACREHTRVSTTGRGIPGSTRVLLVSPKHRKHGRGVLGSTRVLPVSPKHLKHLGLRVGLAAAGAGVQNLVPGRVLAWRGWGWPE